MRFFLALVVVAPLLAPASASACAMPHREGKNLAALMEDIDVAAVPVVPVAVVEAPAPAPAKDAKAVAKPAPAPSVIAEVAAQPDS